jgi:hypothetical protein
MTGKDFEVLMRWATTSGKVPMTLYLMMSAYSSYIDSSKASDYVKIISRLPESDAKTLTMELLLEISDKSAIKPSPPNGRIVII